ncbi:polysaccharide deacetylase family protein [Cyclobacterium lianum]|uniref:polysaccharide deacetylase family protein n=1 Tax=Cyclobacterium lianum TaxID=388280 RepID=UPI001160547F|nr:polysaccharide deacetylase family protein [Cyclobacterium lianum]
MKNLVKKLIFLVLRYTGIPFLIREIWQKNKVTILVFHDPSLAAATKAFDFLSRHYNIIPLSLYLEACLSQDPQILPPKAMVITFDDGHRNNYNLLEIFKKHAIFPTIFLCSGIINTNRHYWFLHQQRKLSDSELKKMRSAVKWKYLERTGFLKDKEFEAPQSLSKAQVIEMSRFVDMQAHTVFHPCLPQADDQESRREITESKAILEQDYGFKICSLAYPNGDYTEREIKFAKEAGFQCGLTVKPGYNTIHSDMFQLKRLDLNDSENINEIVVKASGLWSV